MAGWISLLEGWTPGGSGTNAQAAQTRDGGSEHEAFQNLLKREARLLSQANVTCMGLLLIGACRRSATWLGRHGRFDRKKTGRQKYKESLDLGQRHVVRLKVCCHDGSKEECRSPHGPNIVSGSLVKSVNLRIRCLDDLQKGRQG
jgi:hypothetical protein